MPNLEDITKYLKQLKFKKNILGYIDEVDLWKKIEVIDSMYRKVYEEQEIKIKYLDNRENEKASK